MADLITVEVVYATADRQLVQRVQLSLDSTVMEAIESSRILQLVPDIALDSARLGIFSRRVSPHDRVQNGDRVEIYRPLTLDPKDARRRRARG